MNIDSAFPSKYVKQADLSTQPGQQCSMTISHVAMEDVDGQGNEELPVLYFAGANKGMVLNKGNSAILSETYGTETDNWRGHPVTVYVDHTVTYAGKRTGGLRLRIDTAVAATPAPQPVPTQQPPQPAPEPDPNASEPVPDDDIPF